MTVHTLNQVWMNVTGGGTAGRLLVEAIHGDRYQVTATIRTDSTPAGDTVVALTMDRAELKCFGNAVRDELLRSGKRSKSDD